MQGLNLFGGKTRKGQAGVRGLNDLVPVATAIVLIAVIVGAFSLVLAEFVETDATDPLDDFDITNEVHQPDNNTNSGIGNGGVLVTVDHPGEKGVKSETWTFSDNSAGTNTTLTRGDNYTAPFTTSEGLDNGTYNFTNVDNYEATDGFEAGDDKLFADYTNTTKNPADGVFNKALTAFDTMADFLVVIIVAAIAAVVFVLLGVMRRQGRRTSV